MESARTLEMNLDILGFQADRQRNSAQNLVDNLLYFLFCKYSKKEAIKVPLFCLRIFLSSPQM